MKAIKTEKLERIEYTFKDEDGEERTVIIDECDSCKMVETLWYLNQKGAKLCYQCSNIYDRLSEDNIIKQIKERTLR